MAGWQKGLSLVELMVALLLSCFLVLGVTQVFLDNKRNYLFQQGQVSNQENARFAALAIQRLAARAGYRVWPHRQLPEEAFPAQGASAECPAFAAGQSIALAVDSAGADLCVRYQRGVEQHESDCSGNSLDYSNTPLTVVARLNLDAAKGQLSCAAGGKASVLVDGLLDFSLQPLATSSQEVQMVSVHLLFASPTGQAGGTRSDVLGNWERLTGRKPALDPAEQRLLQIGTASVALRSLMP